MKDYSMIMKRFLQLALWLCCIFAGMASVNSAQAGTWELSHYETNAQFDNTDVAIGSDSNGVRTELHDNQAVWSWQDGESVFTRNGQKLTLSAASVIKGSDHIRLWWNDGRPRFEGNGKQGAQPASSSGTKSITPVFRWKRRAIWYADKGYLPDPDDKPTDELYYTEAATISGFEGIQQWDGNPVPYSVDNPFVGKYFSYEEVVHPFGGAANHFIQNWGKSASHTFVGPQGNSRVTKVAAESEEVRGETRTFSGTIRLNSQYGEVGGAFDHWGYASLYFNYSASPQQFQLDVSAPEIWATKPHPTKGEYNAWVSKKWTGVDAPGSAIGLDWIGAASYTANLSSDLSNQMGNDKEFRWTLSSNLSDDPLNSANVNASHDLGSGSAETGLTFDDGTSSSAKVVIGGDADSEILSASATIKWFQRPYTKYRAEVVTEVINYNTGETTELDSVMSGGNALTTEEERTLDEFTTDYEAMKTEFVGTGAQLVGSALEAEMMVGSWFVPDEVDIATGGLTLAGKPLKQLYKVGKTLKATAEVAARINRVRDKLAGAVPAIRRKLGHSNFAIVMKRKKYRVSREGHIGPNGQREPAPMGELKEEEDILCNIPGGACFVKGTLVSTQDGLRAIETLRAKDLVWSRDAATGTTQLKPIAQTFEKYATTLALTFSNGETVETTREHPFYVESQGFVKAGELGIGTSIVTRAGPSVQLVSVASGDAQTVYNFEVEDYHTYFVGLGEVWVHNAFCGTINVNSEGFEHALNKHSTHGLEDLRGGSQFADDLSRADLEQMARNAQNGSFEESGDHMATVLRSDRIVGIDAYGGATSEYTVVINFRNGDVVTMHPGSRRF